jgi:hypothetical protein
MKYSIKITGSGTPDEIIKSLKNVIGNIEEAKGGIAEIATFDEAKWEDRTLITEMELE